MKTKIACSVMAGCILAAVACTSKYQEGSPSGSAPDAETKREYTLKTQDIKSQIDQAQQLLNGFNDVVSKVKETGNGSASDVVIQILESVRDVSVEKAKDGTYVSYGEVYLPVPGLSTACRTMKTRSIYEEHEKLAKQDISIMTCKTNNAYVNALNITVDDKKGISIASNKNIQSILPEINLKELLSAQNCKLETIPANWQHKELRKVTCQAADLILNSKEKVKFSDLVYSEVDANLFTATAEFFKQEISQFKLIVEIAKNGHVNTTVVDTRPKEDNTINP